MSKNGKIFAVVALNVFTPPSSPAVLGHECPRPFTVKPLITAWLFCAEQSDCLSVVSVCGCDTMALKPRSSAAAALALMEAQPLRSAQASRNWVMLGVASR
jgi:hypothetical protein